MRKKKNKLALKLRLGRYVFKPDISYDPYNGAEWTLFLESKTASHILVNIYAKNNLFIMDIDDDYKNHIISMGWLDTIINFLNDNRKLIISECVCIAKKQLKDIIIDEYEELIDYKLKEAQIKAGMLLSIECIYLFSSHLGKITNAK